MYFAKLSKRFFLSCFRLLVTSFPAMFKYSKRCNATTKYSKYGGVQRVAGCRYLLMEGDKMSNLPQATCLNKQTHFLSLWLLVWRTKLQTRQYLRNSTDPSSFSQKMLAVSTYQLHLFARMHMCRKRRKESLTYCIGHTPHRRQVASAQAHLISACNMATFLLCSNIDTTRLQIGII